MEPNFGILYSRPKVKNRIDPSPPPTPRVVLHPFPPPQRRNPSPLRPTYPLPASRRDVEGRVRASVWVLRTGSGMCVCVCDIVCGLTGGFFPFFPTPPPFPCHFSLAPFLPRPTNPCGSPSSRRPTTAAPPRPSPAPSRRRQLAAALPATTPTTTSNNTPTTSAPSSMTAARPPPPPEEEVRTAAALSSGRRRRRRRPGRQRRPMSAGPRRSGGRVCHIPRRRSSRSVRDLPPPLILLLVFFLLPLPFRTPPPLLPSRDSRLGLVARLG